MNRRMVGFFLVCSATALAVDAGALPPAVVFTEGLSTPESVLYDAQTDTYLVSNINGSPLAKDNNGYVAELSPDGGVVTPKLVAGGTKGVTLNAPKGLALMKGILYVADIDTVRMFDRATGASKGEVKVTGATFVNDVFAIDGLVYATDSGLKAGKDGNFASTGTDGVYVIDTTGPKSKLKTLVKSKALKGPNGVWVHDGTVYVVSFNANELSRFDLGGKPKGEVVTLPNGGLDGVMVVNDEVFVSSWAAKQVWRGTPGGTWTPVGGEQNSPADFGFDTKRNRVLVPRFLDNRVEACDVK